MKRKEFLAWLSRIDELDEAQKLEIGKVLAGHSAGKASVAVVELDVEKNRTCPYCSACGAVGNGKAGGLQRYLCRSCNRTFGAMTGTPMNGLHRKEIWLAYSECLANGEEMAAAAEHCGISLSTAYRWRHRFPAGIDTNTEN